MVQLRFIHGSIIRPNSWSAHSVNSHVHINRQQLISAFSPYYVIEVPNFTKEDDTVKITELNLLPL